MLLFLRVSEILETQSFRAFLLLINTALLKMEFELKKHVF